MTGRLRIRRMQGLWDDAGVTVIEVTVAAVLLAIGALAVLGLVSAANRNNYRATQSQVVNDRLQKEMEAIKGLPYFQVALSRAPSPPSDSSDPNNRVSGTTFNVNGSGSANYETLVRNGARAPSVAQGSDNSLVAGGTVDPGPTPFVSGNVHGNVYRYVTWERDPNCNNCAVKWYRHIVVAVTLDQTASGGTRVYQEIQGNVANPNAGLPPTQGGPGEGGPGEGGGGGGSGGGGGGSGTDTGTSDEQPWTFWLTDTPCSFGARQPIAGEHLTHNTLGMCSDGMHTDGTAGAPDLMFPRSAPCAGGDCTTPQPIYDYATDVEPTQNVDQDKGLQEMTPPDPLNIGCTVNISSLTSLGQLGSNSAFYVHKWVSPPIPDGSSDIVLDGTGALDLWTQTVNSASYPAKICVWLFMRQTVSGAPVDTFVVNLSQTGNPAYFTCSSRDDPTTNPNACNVGPGRPFWPNGAWTEIHLPLHFATLSAGGALGSLHIPAGARLGLAIGIESQGTSPNAGLQFMYDHPSFDSRLEVDTRSLLPVF
jgi:Tfp pilus assembly protein PilV